MYASLDVHAGGLRLVLEMSSTAFLPCYFKARSLNQTQRLLIWLLSLHDLGNPVCLLKLELQLGHHTHLTLMWVLGIQALVLMLAQ